MALPSCVCVSGLPPWKQLAPIVAAARTWAGEIPNQACYEGLPITQQLDALYCALYTVAQGGVGPTPPPVVTPMVMDFVIAPSSSEGDPGDVFSLAMMESSTVGTPSGTWALENGVISTTTLIAAQGTEVTVPMQVGSEVFNGVNNYGYRFDCNNPAPAPIDAGWEGYALNFGAGTVQELLIVSYMILGSNEDPDEVSVNNDWWNISGSRGYIVPQQIQYNGTNIIHAHSNDGLGNDILITDRAKVYEIATYMPDGDTGEVAVLDGDTLIGSSDAPLNGSAGDVAYVITQSYLQRRVGNTDVVLSGGNYSSPTWPHRSYTIPPISPITLIQTNFGELSAYFTGVTQRFVEERATDGGAFVEINSNLSIKSALNTNKAIVMSGLADGTEIQLRIKAKVGTATSTAVTSAVVAVDDANFHGNWVGDLTGYSQATSELGERGVRIQVGNSNIPITSIGCFFLGPPNETYGDVTIRIKDSSNTLITSVVVPRAGATLNDFNYTAIAFTLNANTIYNITRDVAGYKGYPIFGTATINTSIADVIFPIDQDGNDSGGGDFNGGINFTW